MNTNGLESAIRLNRILMQQTLQAGKLTPTQIIACDGLVDEWAPGVYKVNDVRNYAGQTWRCCQDHDSTQTTDWTPTAASSLWAAYHSTDPAHARPWVAPTGAQDAYQAGEAMVWTDGKTYLCKQDNTVHDPAALPAAWEALASEAAPATMSILDGMTVAQLREYADTNGIDLGGATKKADIRAAIEAMETGKVEV